MVSALWQVWRTGALASEQPHQRKLLVVGLPERGDSIRIISARRYAQGANVVVLEADVAKVFPNAEAVNDSLRALAGIIRRQHKALPGK